MNQQLSTYLDQQRVESGLTIRQLADMTGISRSHIGRLVKGEVVRPLAEDLIALAVALEVPTRELFKRAGIELPPEARSVDAFLRTAYDLPDDAVAEAKASIEAIVARYQEQSSSNEGRNP